MPDAYQKNSHCSYCGTGFAADAAYPRRCGHCGSVTYSNPLPVAVVLLPIDPGGLLLVKRVQEPAAGKWGLPGGFVETGETWQEAGAREVFEETGFTVDPIQITLFDTRSARTARCWCSASRRPSRLLLCHTSSRLRRLLP